MSNDISSKEPILVRGGIESLFQGESIHDLIMAYMKENHVPGLSLAIVQAPYITQLVGYGMADKDTKRLVSTKTVFAIGEMTNGYTAVAIMQLKEEGKLDLTDSLGGILQNMPKTWHTITIHDLLTHSSGIADYTKCAEFDRTCDYQSNEICMLVQNQPLLFKPGTEMQYSATNSYVLGMVIEVVSGMSYQAHVTKNQINRVGLKNTFFISNIASIRNEVKDPILPNHALFLKDPTYMNPPEDASGYEQEEESLVQVKRASWGATFSASGIIASAEDISLWDIALAGEIFVKDPKNRAFLYNSAQLKDGLFPGNAGWEFPGHHGLMFLRGNISGYSTILTRYTSKADLLCVTLLANKGNLPDLDILSRKIAAALQPHLRIPEGAHWSETIQSPYSVKVTIERATQLIHKKGGVVFAHVHHSDEAKAVNQTLPETEVIVIGNPAKGTFLMQKNAAIALDLPFRIMSTQDESGHVWLSFTDPIKLAKAYQLNTEELFEIQKIAIAIRSLCQAVVSAQSIYS